MSQQDKKKQTGQDKKRDGSFGSKNIKHGQDESARAKFGLKNSPPDREPS